MNICKSEENATIIFMGEGVILERDIYIYKFIEEDFVYSMVNIYPILLF